MGIFYFVSLDDGTGANSPSLKRTHPFGAPTLPIPQNSSTHTLCFRGSHRNAITVPDSPAHQGQPVLPDALKSQRAGKWLWVCAGGRSDRQPLQKRAGGPQVEGSPQEVSPCRAAYSHSVVPTGEVSGMPQLGDAHVRCPHSTLESLRSPLRDRACSLSTCYARGLRQYPPCAVRPRAHGGPGEDAVRVPVYRRGLERWSPFQEHKAAESGWTHFSLPPQPGTGTCVQALRQEIAEGGGEGRADSAAQRGLLTSGPGRPAG